jgi:hypothetical protein
LKELNHITEEDITKHKIIAMGEILGMKILEKVVGNSNKIVEAFCQNIELHQIKRCEISIYVFYFLHQLLVYMRVDEDIEFKAPSKLKIFSKTNLDLKEFFTKILPDIGQYLNGYYKEGNPQQKLKECTQLEETLSPFKEKSKQSLKS